MVVIIVGEEENLDLSVITLVSGEFLCASLG